MAAELSTLASSFLDTEPENYALFLLDCIDAKQNLNGDITSDGWVGRVNSLLNSKNERWLGVCLLGRTVKQCDTDTFTRNCSSWIRAILQTIQVPEEKSVIQCCSKVLDNVLKYACEFPELSRELSSTVIPSLISTTLSSNAVTLLIAEGDNFFNLSTEFMLSDLLLLVTKFRKEEERKEDACNALSIITSCIHWFPGPVGPFRKRIENYLLSFLNSSYEEVVKAACHCYAMLPRCSSSGASRNRQVISWEEQWKRVLSTIHKLLDVAYENAEPVDSVPAQQWSSEILQMAEVPDAEPSRTYHLVTQCNSLLLCLSAMIREELLKVVVVPIDATIQLLTRILAVSGSSLQNAVVMESVLLRASLPLIHKNAVDLLKNFISRCGKQLLPFCDVLLKILVLELTWTRTQDPKHGQERPYGKLRCSVYSCIECWVKVTKNLPQERGILPKLVQCIMEDIKPPLSSQVKLFSTSSSGNQSKKAKKRKLQDVDQLVAGHQKLDKRANEVVTYRALEVLSATIISNGSEIPNEVFQEIQVCVLKLILQIQRSAYSACPIPYSSEDCRHALYHVLLSCVLNNLAQVPSPINYAVSLFSFGCQDVSLKVASFCQEAMAVTNSIIHPRSFPHTCSFPLLITSSETPALNGPSEMNSTITLDQGSTSTRTGRSQDQHGLAGGNDASGNVSSPLEQIPSEHCHQQNGICNSANLDSLADVGRKPPDTSSLSEELKIISYNDKTRHPTNSNHKSGTEDISMVTETVTQQSSTVYTDSSAPKPVNEDTASATFATQTTLSVVNQETVSFGNGASHPKDVDGPTDPKRMRLDGVNSSSVVAEPLVNAGTLSKSDRDELASSKENNQTETIDDYSEETKKLLAAFVDSCPDSDDLEMD